MYGPIREKEAFPHVKPDKLYIKFSIPLSNVICHCDLLLLPPGLIQVREYYEDDRWRYLKAGSLTRRECIYIAYSCDLKSRAMKG